TGAIRAQLAVHGIGAGNRSVLARVAVDELLVDRALHGVTHGQQGVPPAVWAAGPRPQAGRVLIVDPPHTVQLPEVQVSRLLRDVEAGHRAFLTRLTELRRLVVAER